MAGIVSEKAENGGFPLVATRDVPATYGRFLAALEAQRRYVVLCHPRSQQDVRRMLRMADYDHVRVITSETLVEGYAYVADTDALELEGK